MSKPNNIKRIKLSNIVVEKQLLEIRKLDLHAVSRYRQAMREGSQFPNMIIERGTNRLVSGNHRYQAYNEEFGLDYVVTVELRNYENDIEFYHDAIKENADHGMPLSTIEKTRFTDLLLSFYTDSENYWFKQLALSGFFWNCWILNN